MATLGVWTLLLTTACLGGSFVHGIVGGRDTTIERFPYQVSVQVDKEHQCGGSILNEVWVISSASCVQKVKTTGVKVYVRAGSTFADKGGTYHEVMNAIYEKDFSQNGKVSVNDIVLLQLKDHIVLSDVATPVQLTNEEPQPGQKLTLTGWGSVDDSDDSSSVLQVVRIPAMSRGVCRLAYGDPEVDIKFSADMICAGVANKDFCNRDGGAPLMVETANGLVQVGIASFSLRGCGEPGLPSVFTNLANGDIIQWIKYTTGL